MEEAIVRGVAHDTSDAKVTVHGVPDQPGVAAAVFEPLAVAGVNVDIIVQNVSHAGTHRHLASPSPRSRPTWPVEITEADAQTSSAPAGVDLDANIAKVSLVGAGMKSELGIAGRMFRILVRPRHQHRDDLYIADSHILRRAGQRRRGRRRSLHDGFRLAPRLRRTA